MKQLHKDQAGIAHLILVLVFVAAFAGLAGFAYTRINDKQAATSQTASEDTQDEAEIEDVDDQNDEDLTQDEASDLEDNQES